MRLKLVPSDTSFDFMRLRLPALGFSGLLVTASILMFALVGLNLGIDFRGGILIEARSTDGPADIGGMRSDLGTLGLGDISLQEFGSDTDILVRVQRQDGDEKAQIAAITAITDTLGDSYNVRRTEFVGPTVGAELAQKGIYAVGDICNYPGKLKLILSGFHEGALAARACFKLARPNEKYRFEFTTSSKAIKDRLGVKSD